MEVTLAFFHIPGKIPNLNEELNIAASSLHKIFAASFTNCTEISSYPADFWHFNSNISLSKISEVIA